MLTYVNAPTTPDRVLLETTDEPRPAPGELVVEVRATSLNRGELMLLAALPAGWRPGWDVTGTVVAAAADGSGPPAGTRVVAQSPQGGWAERVAVGTDRVGVLPASVDFATAATLPVAGVTALKTVRLGGSLLGRKVLVTGASGAVGRFQVQLAALAGARVTAVAADRHAARLRELGAVAVVPQTDAASGGFHLVTDAVGGANLEQAVGQVAPGGTVVMFGMTAPEPASIGLGLFRGGHENARLQTFNLSASAAGLGAELEILATLVAGGKLAVDIARKAPFGDLPGCLAALRDRAFAGKAVIQVGRS